MTKPGDTPDSQKTQTPEQRSAIGKLIRFCLENKLIVGMFMFAIILAGVLVAPFEW